MKIIKGDTYSDFTFVLDTTDGIPAKFTVRGMDEEKARLKLIANFEYAIRQLKGEKAK